MTLPSSSTHAQPGDLAQLVSPSNKVFTVLLIPGSELQTHRGVVNFDELIGQPWGSQVYSHKGSSFFLWLIVGAVMVILPGGRLDVAAGIPWQVVGLTMVLGVSVAMLAAAYPARLAARLPIVQAVQFD